MCRSHYKQIEVAVIFKSAMDVWGGDIDVQALDISHSNRLILRAQTYTEKRGIHLEYIRVRLINTGRLVFTFIVFLLICD